MLTHNPASRAPEDVTDEENVQKDGSWLLAPSYSLKTVLAISAVQSELALGLVAFVRCA
jgi:hypothetical protein